MRTAETAGGSKYHLLADDAPRADAHWTGARVTLCGRAARPVRHTWSGATDEFNHCQTCEAKRVAAAQEEDTPENAREAGRYAYAEALERGTFTNR